MMNRLLSMLACAVLAACSPGAPEAPPLAGARIGGAFTAIAEDGKAVNEKDYAGQYRIVYFGYTFCPDVCPVDLRNLMLGLKALETTKPDLAKQIQPLFFTTDPARDTPAILTEYTGAFHPRLIGLTGSDAQVVANQKTFAVFASKGEARPDGGYLVDHSRVAYLFGKRGEPIAILPHDGTPQQIADELARWMQ
jgi:protein SCO1